MQVEVDMVVKSSYVLKNKNLKDKEIYFLAQQKGFVIIVTKDADFSILVTQFGSPPKIIKLNTEICLQNYFGINLARILNPQ